MPDKRGSNYDKRWYDAASLIARQKLPGLQVRCGHCGEMGTLMSKWVKGNQTKPFFVVHSLGSQETRVCPLSTEEAREARSLVRFTSKDVAKTLKLGSAFVLFSGGKDSLCLLKYMKRAAARVKAQLTAVHADTTAGFPEVEEYVRMVCRKLDVPLVTVRPERSFYDLAKKWGIPGVKSRWCCETLKVAPIRRYLSSFQGPKVVYDGIRAAESNVRGTYNPVWYHPSFRCLSVSPLFHWSDSRVDSYITRHRLPESPAFHLGTSAECWCGAYKRVCDFRALLDTHPEIFDKLVEVEKAQNGKYTFIYENGKQVPLASLKSR